jgi:hypothetical protein
VYILNIEWPIKGDVDGAQSYPLLCLECGSGTLQEHGLLRLVPERSTLERRLQHLRTMSQRGKVVRG